MNKLHDLLSKLQAIEEAAKTSDIPAAHRKAKNPEDWKVSMKDLDDEEKEGKISHKDNLAKNNDRADEGSEEPISDVAPENSEIQGGAGASDESMEECGGDMEPKGGNVSMSMQDLLALMSHLQKGVVGQHDEPLMGDERVGEEYGNDAPGGSESEVMPVAAVTPTGNDMFSKGKEAPKVNGGGNPMAEALAALYADVKTRQLDELSKDTLKSYTKKAKADYSNAHSEADMHRNHGNKAEMDAAGERTFKRAAGLGKAIDKLSLKEANEMARKLRK